MSIYVEEDRKVSLCCGIQWWKLEDVYSYPEATSLWRSSVEFTPQQLKNNIYLLSHSRRLQSIKILASLHSFLEYRFFFQVHVAVGRIQFLSAARFRWPFLLTVRYSHSQLLKASCSSYHMTPYRSFHIMAAYFFKAHRRISPSSLLRWSLIKVDIIMTGVTITFVFCCLEAGHRFFNTQGMEII